MTTLKITLHVPPRPPTPLTQPISHSRPSLSTTPTKNSPRVLFPQLITPPTQTFLLHYLPSNIPTHFPPSIPHYYAHQIAPGTAGRGASGVLAAAWSHDSSEEMIHKRLLAGLPL
ncbi:hypothetical protein E2C01_060148 [Portunus trituberculatus]|uniref:Uncharacterized protein n=1 Tax=Portunus trituberculatus TaxID=210409 RepID=A0A5B7H8I0_PORTR|nr:hypothetical protein [Portunus trituberculatus]